MANFRLLTLDPGHFHAALVQKSMYPDVAPSVHVYGPLGPDLTAHLNRIIGFNTRAENPTAWDLEIHAGPNFLERLLSERPGNVVVLAGRNRKKIDYILAAVEAGLHVLADKPWVISSADLPKLQKAFEIADQKGLVIYDIMTERFEITSILQRALVQDAEIFGSFDPGAEQRPGIYMESVHYLIKTVAGVPLRRPTWFFDIHEQGEGLTDVGTHLVDLVSWVAFPDSSIDRQDIRILRGKRWPTALSPADFEKMTGEKEFPKFLAPYGSEGLLHYFCNNSISYTLRGVHVHLDVLWKTKAAAGPGDSHLATFRGTRSRVEIRQSKKEAYRPEIFVAPRKKENLGPALDKWLARISERFPGVAVESSGKEFHITVPPIYRVGHEAHFAEVTRLFLTYLKDPRSMPAWERPNMLSKYFITTAAVEMARDKVESGNVLEQFHEAFCSDYADRVQQLLQKHPELKEKINEPLGPFDSPAIVNAHSARMVDVLLDAGADLDAKSSWWAGGFGLLHSTTPEVARHAINRGATVDVHAAARLGLLEQLRAMITAEPALVHARGGDGQTPLHFAATVEIAEFLLDNGADIDARDVDHESTPAQWMLEDRQDVARYLVRRGCKTDLLIAAALGDIELARRLLDADPECIRIRVTDQYFPMTNRRAGGTIYQWTLGFHASPHTVAKKFGHEALLQLLMDRSPPDVRLLVACWLGDADEVRKLSAAQPDLVSQLGESDRRQIVDAARNNETATVGLMLEAGLPADALGQHAGTALHWAAFHGNREMAEALLARKPALELRDADFHATPLGWAMHGSEHGWHRHTGDYAGTVEALLRAGATLPDKVGGSQVVCEVLRRHGAK